MRRNAARIAVGLMALAAPALHASVAAPKAVVAEAHHDLGMVGLGEPATAEFVVSNDGDAVLELKKPETSPGLRVSSFDAAIAPNSVGRVKMEVDTFACGPRVTAAFATNDPAMPVLRLTVAIDVKAFVAATPGYARYLTVQGEREGTITQLLLAPDGSDFRVTSVDAPYAHLRTSFREARPEERETSVGGRQWCVESTLDSNAPVGDLAGILKIHVDHPRQKQVLIPVSGFVRPILAVTPPAARLGDLDLAQPHVASFFVKNFAEQTFAITGAASDVAGIRAEVVPIEEGRTWTLHVTVLPEAAVGEFNGSIRLKTANPKLLFFDLPLSGRVLSGPAAH
jgi:hypothetical protein